MSPSGHTSSDVVISRMRIGQSGSPRRRPRAFGDEDTADSRDRDDFRADSDLAVRPSHVPFATIDPHHYVDIMRCVAVGLFRIPFSKILEILAVEEPPKLAQISLGEIPVGEHLGRMVLQASILHGSSRSTPVCAKSLTLRVAQVALCARQIAAICASAVLIGAPALSRATSTSA